ncbi:hypothetical protein OM428_02600 [Enterococcus gallinarum]|nr:hypothetical protein [Enterococcus gallinarum]
MDDGDDLTCHIFSDSFQLDGEKRLRKQRINAGMSGIILFLIIISPQVIADGEPGFSHSALGAGGMFIAIVAGLFAGMVLNLFGKFSFSVRNR